eukprot:COSAG03_NODE_11806_length_575_cov_0.985294_1_plen_93_part_01
MSVQAQNTATVRSLAARGFAEGTRSGDRRVLTVQDRHHGARGDCWLVDLKRLSCDRVSAPANRARAYQSVALGTSIARAAQQPAARRVLIAGH